MGLLRTTITNNPSWAPTRASKEKINDDTKIRSL